MTLSPVLISNFSKTALNSQQFEELAHIDPENPPPPYDENWLQDLIHKNPALVPANKIEAAFDRLIPVARELALPHGFLDNFFITPDGYPVLVEVKLIKNQEARRKVIAQILEYANDFSRLSYEDLNQRLRSILSKEEAFGDNPLYEIVSRSASGCLGEAEFVDNVSRHMREGRFLLLILGDCINADMATLAKLVDQHHTLRYTLGIVQIRLFRVTHANDTLLLAVPDVLAQTVRIERHVTVVNSTPLATVPENASRSEKQEESSITRDEFFAALETNSKDGAAWLREFLRNIQDLPIDQQFGKNSLMLKAAIGRYPTVLYITPVSVSCWAVGQPQYINNPEIGVAVKSYLDRVASVVAGEVKAFPAGGLDVRIDDKAPPIGAFLTPDSSMKLKAAISDLIHDLTVSESNAA